ncbi:MAG: peptidylprolyl isomerase [Clostridia bacterium]|nr:peptidylprolyl isomerase [Clostridia bacterium]
MKHFKLRKILICAVSAAVVTSACVSLGACNIETAHPEAEITYEFNGETYAVKYTLYRDLRPHTVRHFIELANEGFYDGTIVHDFDSSDWFTGGYSYDSEDYTAKKDNAGQMAEYFEAHAKEDAYVKLYADGKLSKTVFKESAYNDVTEKIENANEYVPALMGEFYNNIHQEFDNDPLNAEIGCLKTYYYDKTTTNKVFVTPTSDQTIRADYSNNCTTSLFAVQTSSSSSYSRSDYCVFARLSSTDAFYDLTDAVNDYITNEHGGTRSNFYNETTVHVDNNDNYSDKAEADKGKEVKFKAPKTPIIIKTVKITKY